MYEFIDRLVNIALQELKILGVYLLKELILQIIILLELKSILFSEVNFDKVDKIRGLDITIVTNSKNKKGTTELLKEFNFPLTMKKWGINGKKKCNRKK